MRRNFALPFIVMLLSWHCAAQEYVVIGNKALPQLSVTQIRAVYLKKLPRIATIKTVPVNLGAGNPLRQSFERTVLQMGFQRLQSYWSRQHYLGHRPPVTMKSQESALAFVKNVEGAIAYVHAALVDDEVHVLYRWNE